VEQNYHDIEYVVVDPGSTDGSHDIIERYQSRISRIIYEPDRGPVDGLNKGLAHAKSDVFAFLNSEDVLLPGAVRSALAFRNSNDVDVVTAQIGKILGSILMRTLECETSAELGGTLNLEDAVSVVRGRFPFPDYLDRSADACTNIAKSIVRHLRPSKNINILDFGCGACDKTAVVSAVGYHCCGYDDLQDDWHKIPENREAIIKFAANMGIDFRLANEDELPWGPGTFDLIMLNDIVEHLHNSPRSLLNNLLELVKEDGFLLITVPNAVNIRKRIEVLLGRTNYQNFDLYYWYTDPWRGHVREYTKGDLRLLAANLGLAVVELQSCDHMLRRIPASVRAPYLAVTGVFRGWKDSWLLIARKEKGWKPREMTRAELAHLMVGLGLGAYPSTASK
jgi:glycosyltransferase involved in cell wall biosynthesis